ncbi:hypothetical protein BV22DRAFT_857695 [Leucogyrophana mollusca]|uniref:Uncharacterized protein n=1 Tax=Leucogyrophana mollusca TaxID=85980 RepID=A0ACB8B1E2_9AGAM|nr:hypothetical protein BV22DRAFT_857695 [Leucogyrophana mollusca]
MCVMSDGTHTPAAYTPNPTKSTISQHSANDTKSCIWAIHNRAAEDYDSEFLEEYKGGTDIHLINTQAFSLLTVLHSLIPSTPASVSTLLKPRTHCSWIWFASAMC